MACSEAYCMSKLYVDVELWCLDLSGVVSALNRLLPGSKALGGHFTYMHLQSC